MANRKINGPDSVASMVWGICSIASSFLIIGLVFCIICLVKGKKATNAILDHPDEYTGEAFIKAGRITSILGIVFSGLAIIYWIIFALIILYACTY